MIVYMYNVQWTFTNDVTYFGNPTIVTIVSDLANTSTYVSRLVTKPIIYIQLVTLANTLICERSLTFIIRTSVYLAGTKVVEHVVVVVAATLQWSSK